MKSKNQNVNQIQTDEHDHKLGHSKSKMFLSTKITFIHSMVTVMSFIESILFLLVS